MNPKGVMKIDNKRVVVCGNTKNKGVMGSKNHCLDYSSQRDNKILKFSRPCICGSLDHFSTKHIHCLLNSRYADATEQEIVYVK